MKIRTKITGIQLITTASILLSIYMLFVSLQDIQKLKYVQVTFNRFIDVEDELQDILLNSLYMEENIVVYEENLRSKYDELTGLINNIYDQIEDDYDDMKTNFKQFYYAWYHRDANYYQRVSNEFRNYAKEDSGWVQIISNNGLLIAYDILTKEKENGLGDDEKLKSIIKSINLIDQYKDTDREILALLEKVQADLKYEVDKNIATDALFLVLFTMFIVTFCVLMNNKVAKELIYKVHNVEDSLKKISEGELAIQVSDNNDDEFSQLTESFNTLTTMLVNKTTSMKEVMNEISDIISEDINIDALMSKIVEMAKMSSNADSATILLVDKFSDILRVEHTEGFFPPPYSVSISVKSKRSLIEEKFKSTPIPFNSSYLSKDSVLKGEPLFIKDSELDGSELPMNSNPQDILFIKSSMTIPLVVSKKLFGVISLAKTKRNETFSDLDYSNMVSFVEYVSLTIDNLYKYMELLEKSEMKREMNIASEIQSRLLPKKIPVLPNIDVSAFSDSARGISGDYYDIYKISKNKSVATVCDVAGKGIAAALVLVIIRTILQLASNTKSTAKDLLTFLNKSISDRVKTDYFATLSILVYDNETNEISLSIAGDTPILIYRSKDQVVERITHHDIPVGIDTSTTYSNRSIKLDEDDVLYMFSDGLLEVRNDFNDIFSIDELESFILEHSNNRTETISVLLKDYLKEFRGAQERMDDETVIIFKKI